MGITKIKFKRSFSNGNADVLSALQTGNMTLSYGEPLWFKNSFYIKPKFFIGNDSGVPMFVGPYHSGNEYITVDNTVTSPNVGKITFNATPFNTAINGLDGRVTILEQHTELLCTMTLTDASTGTYSCDKTVTEIEAAYISGRLVLCKYNNMYYYATLVESSEHVVWFWSADNVKFHYFHNAISGEEVDNWVHGTLSMAQEDKGEVTAASLNNLDWRVDAIEDAITGNGDIEVKNLKVTSHVILPEGVVPNEQIQSDWEQSDTYAKDYIKNKPTIPAAQVNADWNAVSGVAQILNKPTIPAAQVQADWDEIDDSKPEYIKNKPTIPTVNNATLTVQRNDTTVGTFTANASIDQIINIDVPVNASDVNALPSSTKYGTSMSISIDSTTYVMKAQLKDQDGSNLGNASIVDLPLESMVVNGSYNSSTKKVVLTLQSGSTVEFSVADLVVGLQSEITAQNPLSADLVVDGTTNKVFTMTLKNKLDGIESGAQVNVQSDWNQTSTTSDDYIKNKPSIPANTSDLTNDSGFITEVDLEESTEVAAAAFNNLDQRIEAVEDAITGNGDIEVKNLVVTSHVVLPEGAIPDSQIQSDWEQTDADAKDYIKNKPIIPAAQVNADWNATSGVAQILNKPIIPIVNNATLTIQKNGSTVDTFTANASQDKTINIIVPTTASDVSALPASTKYAASIDLSINSTTYVMSAQLKDQDGNNIGSADTIDLPLESVVVNGSYNASTKKVMLTLQSGSTIEFSVADLVAGLQSEITSSNKLSADLISDGTSNKVYTAAEQTKLSGIASGAEVNVQSDWSVTDNTSDAFIKNKPSIPSKTSDITNDSGFITSSDIPQEMFSFTLTNNGSTITSDATIVSIAAAFAAGKSVVAKYNVYQGNTLYSSNNYVCWAANENGATLIGFTGIGLTWESGVPKLYSAGMDAIVYDAGDWIYFNKFDIGEKLTDYNGRIDSDLLKAGNNNKLFTSALKTKLDGIASGAEVNVQSDWNQTNTSADDYIKNKPTIPAAQVNSDWEASSGAAQILNKPNIEDATEVAATSLNDLYRRILALESKVHGGDIIEVQKLSVSREVELPAGTIPAAQVNSDWNASSGVAQILNKPTIPTVNNATLTIQQNGTTIDTFTANASSDKTINIQAQKPIWIATVKEQQTASYVKGLYKPSGSYYSSTDFSDGDFIYMNVEVDGPGTGEIRCSNKTLVLYVFDEIYSTLPYRYSEGEMLVARFSSTDNCFYVVSSSRAIVDARRLNKKALTVSSGATTAYFGVGRSYCMASVNASFTLNIGYELFNQAESYVYVENYGSSDITVSIGTVNNGNNNLNNNNIMLPEDPIVVPASSSVEISVVCLPTSVIITTSGKLVSKSSLS